MEDMAKTTPSPTKKGKNTKITIKILRSIENRPPDRDFRPKPVGTMGAKTHTLLLGLTAV